jgi:hypothetical protein
MSRFGGDFKTVSIAIDCNNTLVLLKSNYFTRVLSPVYFNNEFIGIYFSYRYLVFFVPDFLNFTFVYFNRNFFAVSNDDISVVFFGYLLLARRLISEIG